MKIEKISKMALYICVGIIVVCFVAFFGIGYSNPVGDYNEPKLLDLLVISLVVGVLCGWGEEAFTAQDGTVTSGPWVTVVDMFCISSAILFLAAAVAVVVSMTGIMTTMGNKQTKTIK